MKNNYIQHTDEILQMWNDPALNKNKSEIARRIQAKYFPESNLHLVRMGVTEIINNKEKKGYKPVIHEPSLSDEAKSICINEDGSIRGEYKGEKPITSKAEAIEFFEVDTDKFEIAKATFKSWDVSMKKRIAYNKSTGSPLKEGEKAKEIIYKDVDEKRTNYGCTIELKPIEKINLIDYKIEPFQFKATKKAQMWLVIGCIHRPFHHRKLWAGVMQLIHDYRKELKGIIINGDYLDLRSLSSHEEYLPDGINLEFEYNDGRKGISEIEQALGKNKDINKVFHYGNHEDRFLRDKKSLMRYGSALMTPEEALRLNELGYQIQYDWKNGFTTLGNDLDVFHGQYYSKNSGAKHLEMIGDRSCLYNHTHRIQSFNNGKHTAYNIGWLGDEKSEGFKWSNRFTRAAWKNGFSIVYVDDNGNHSVHMIEAIGNKFFFGGRVYG